MGGYSRHHCIVKLHEGTVTRSHIGLLIFLYTSRVHSSKINLPLASVPLPCRRAPAFFVGERVVFPCLEASPHPNRLACRGFPYFFSCVVGILRGSGLCTLEQILVMTLYVALQVGSMYTARGVRLQNKFSNFVLCFLISKMYLNPIWTFTVSTCECILVYIYFIAHIFHNGCFSTKHYGPPRADIGTQ